MAPQQPRSASVISLHDRKLHLVGLIPERDRSSPPGPSSRSVRSHHLLDESNRICSCQPIPSDLKLLNRLWRLVSLRCNFFTPTRKAVGYAITTDGRRKRIYDKSKIPWQRVQASAVFDTQQLSAVAGRVEASTQPI